MIKLINVYQTAKKGKLRAKVKVGNRILRVKCGQSLPREVGEGAYISEICRAGGKFHITVTTNSVAMRIGTYSMEMNMKLGN